MGKKVSRSKARQRRHIRVRKRIFGTPDRPRLNVFRSLSEIYAQVIDDEEGRTLVSASSIDNALRKSMAGKTKTEQAELVGQALAERAKSAGIKQVVFDRSGYRYIGRIKALADGARAGGLQF
ncbi:MAG: 50S ribosomal protein L18 [Chloroflexota bacterium]|nr:MAG: 50S ribosomal protein L18 [Chloroflexota bacterium]